MINDRTAWEAFYRAISVMNRPQVWVPLLAYMLLKLVFLAGYAMSVGTGTTGFWSWFVGEAARAQLNHYPNGLYLLPVVLGRLDQVLQVTVGAILKAASIAVFMHAMRQDHMSLASAFRRVRSRYLPIIIVTLCAAVVLFTWFWLQQIAYFHSPTRARYITVAFFAGGIGLRALFVYALPITVLDDDPPFRALLNGFKAVFADPVRAVLMVFVPFIITAPALYVANQGPSLALKLSPEIVIWIQILQELAYWPATVLLMGGLAALFVRRKKA